MIQIYNGCRHPTTSRSMAIRSSRRRIGRPPWIFGQIVIAVTTADYRGTSSSFGEFLGGEVGMAAALAASFTGSLEFLGLGEP